jgi:hypothetical protein
MKRRIGVMIRVIYRDGKEDQVTQKFLDILLHMNEVQMFQRNSDWAIIGVDAVRTDNRSKTLADERRRHQQTCIQPLQIPRVPQMLQACC